LFYNRLIGVVSIVCISLVGVICFVELFRFSVDVVCVFIGMDLVVCG